MQNTEDLKSDTLFNPGDRVRVIPEWLTLHPHSPLPSSGVLMVCAPGPYATVDAGPNDIPITFDGDIWSVPAEYLERVEG